MRKVSRGGRTRGEGWGGCTVVYPYREGGWKKRSGERGEKNSYTPRYGGYAGRTPTMF